MWLAGAACELPVAWERAQVSQNLQQGSSTRPNHSTAEHHPCFSGFEMYECILALCHEKHEMWYKSGLPDHNKVKRNVHQKSLRFVGRSGRSQQSDSVERFERIASRSKESLVAATRACHSVRKSGSSKILCLHLSLKISGAIHSGLCPRYPHPLVA